MNRHPILGALVWLILLPALAATGGFIVWQALISPPRTQSNSNTIGRTQPQFQPDPILGYAPHVHFDDVQIMGAAATDIHTDRLGARVSRHGDETAGKVDLLAIGCSQTFGHGIPNYATFTSVLGQRMRVPVANFGLSGQGGVGSLKMMERMAVLKPKVVVYGLWEDHFRRNLTRCVSIPGPVCVQMPRITFDAANAPILELPDAAYASDFEEARRYFAETSAEYATPFSDIQWTAMTLWRKLRPIDAASRIADTRKQADATRLVLFKMKEAADGIGARLIAVYIPIYFSEIAPAPDWLATTASDLGVELVDAGPALTALKAANQPFMLPLDGHLNEAGHNAIALAVHERLRAAR